MKVGMDRMRISHMRRCLLVLVAVLAVCSFVLFIGVAEAEAPPNRTNTAATSSITRGLQQNQGNTQERVELSLVIMRHGDRSPIICLPSEQQCNERWPNGLGELTARGLNESFTLGQILRQRYMEQYNMITPRYASTAVRARSTDYDRTHRTAIGVLHGLFPPGTGPVQPNGHPGLTKHRLEAIPVYSTPRQYDSLLRAFSDETCPAWRRFADEEREVNAEEYTRIKKASEELRRELADMAGLRYLDLGLLNKVRDSLNVMRLYRYPWPEGMTEAKMETLTKLSNEMKWLRWSTPEVQKASTGRMVDEVLSRMQAASVGAAQRGFRPVDYASPKSGPQLYLYSSHDTFLAAMFRSLNMDYRGSPNPPYLSTLVFELVRRPVNQFFVRAFYNKGLGTYDRTNSGERHPPPFSGSNIVTFPGCEEQSVNGLCPLDKFISLLERKRLSQTEWDRMCEVGGKNTQSECSHRSQGGPSERIGSVSSTHGYDSENKRLAATSGPAVFSAWSVFPLVLMTAVGVQYVRRRLRL
eukprot:gb/GECG01009920.1/.p1 GENE.gb/GECG01009920.1/~~gb/GECG01009920.1/.p1  ORF type:complete len:526 (+),score=31.03 gb/GECG01009920.1/:1-1578(+)